MKKALPLLLLFFSAQIIQAQTCKGLSLGTKTVYPAPGSPYSAPPAGYSPVFINYVGRHGARHMTKDLRESDTYRLLQRADSVRALSADGQKLWQMVQRLAGMERKEIKNISSLGKSEQQGIGRRMVEKFPAVFNTAHPSLNVTVTKEVRTVQSADAFLVGLQQKITAPVMRRQVNDTILRFYDLSPAYQQFKEGGPWTATVLQLETAEGYSQLSRRTANRFFTTAFANNIKPADQQTFAADVVSYANILYSLPAEIREAGMGDRDLLFTQFFNCDELKKFSLVDNAEEFLVKGPGTDPSGIQVRIAVPLLIDFIRSTDNAIQAKPYNAELRFTHAEAIAPFAVLMNIQGASTPARTGTGIAKAWDASKVIPLSANIQWILYKKDNRDEYLVQFLLNEKEARIEGLSPKQFPYYDWRAVRKFYTDRLAKLQASLDTDGLAYLKGLAGPKSEP
ncbi:MAG: histidine-type phosphatase [Williamsia sp.]|nr:histidine-type phosphatase [Williamsia sp.]